VTPETLLAVISAGFAAFAGLAKALGRFNEKLDRRLGVIEKSVDELEDTLLRDYVLKQDFTREVQSIHHKLDRIWEFMVNQNR
jgi:hypothetical protein